MSIIDVVASIIVESGRLFVAERGYGEWQGYYELPGGKIEEGETHENALKREIAEELETEIRVEHLVETVEYDYPQFHLTMHCYLCQVQRGKLTLVEHSDAKWVDAEEVANVRWLPANEVLIETLQGILYKSELNGD